MHTGQQSRRGGANNAAAHALVPLVLGLVVGEEFLQAHGILNGFAPHLLIHQLEEQDAVAVLLHQHAVVLVLGVEAAFFELGQALLHVLVVELLHGKAGLRAGAGPLVLLHVGEEVAHVVRLVLDEEQGHFAAAGFGLRRFHAFARHKLVLEAAGYQSRIRPAEGINLRGRNLHKLVFLAHALEESGLVELRARVFRHLGFQAGFEVGKLGQRLLLNQLDDVPAVGRLDGGREVAGLLQLEGGFLERGNHAAGAEGRQLAAVGGRAGIFRKLGHELVPALALLQAAIQLVNFLAGRERVGLGGAGVHPNHQVGHLDFALRRALVVYLDDVVAKARADGGGNLAHWRFVGGRLERVHHLHGCEVAQLAAVFAGRGVFAVGAGQLAEIGAGYGLLAQGGNLVIGRQGVGRGRIGRYPNEDVRGAHFLAHAVVGLAYQLVGHAFFGEVGLGQLLAVAIELALESLRGIEAALFGFQHLQAEVGVEVEVVGHALAGGVVGGRAVVFAVHVGKLVGRNRVAAQHFHRRPGRGRHRSSDGRFGRLATRQQCGSGRAGIQNAFVHKQEKES